MPATALARDTHRRRARRSRESVKAKAIRKAPAKAEPMSLRIDTETRALIDRAASVVGQNRTEFMLTSARDRATEVLLNQTFFLLPTADWKAFVSAMDSSPPPNAKLKALLARKMPWETD